MIVSLFQYFLSIYYPQEFLYHMVNTCILLQKVVMVSRASVISTIVWKCCIDYASLTAMFNLLHSSKNQEMFEKHLCNQSSYCKIWKVLYTLVNTVTHH